MSLNLKIKKCTSLLPEWRDRVFILALKAVTRRPPSSSKLLKAVKNTQGIPVRAKDIKPTSAGKFLKLGRCRESPAL
jgi:hypothetical protein